MPLQRILALRITTAPLYASRRGFTHVWPQAAAAAAADSTSMVIMAGPDEPAVSSHGPRRKLSGRAFYESLGSPKMILAPMVDQSEFAWRLLTRSYMKPEAGTLLAYTPMLHSRLFVEQAKYRDQSFQPLREGWTSKKSTKSQSNARTTWLDGRRSDDRPLIVQFCANDPQVFLEAAQYVAPYCDAVDLNLGCPQGIARKGHYGSFLQEDQDLICRMINKLHVELEVPVTAKMRILDTKEETLQYARRLLDAGASILTVHGRRREQKGHNTGLADWTVIRYLRDHLPPDTVLFANGNILSHDDFARCLEATGADGVMSAEGNLYDPTIFAPPPVAPLPDGSYWIGHNGKGGYRLDAIFRRYLDIIYQHVLEEPIPIRPPLLQASDSPPLQPELPERSSDKHRSKRRKPDDSSAPKSPNLVSMQRHLFHLLRPLVSVHTEVRDALAKSHGGNMAMFEYTLALAEKAIHRGLQDYARDPQAFDEPLPSENAVNSSSTAEVTADTSQEQPASENASSQTASSTDGTTSLSEHESSLRTVQACRRPWWVAQPYVRPLPAEAIAKGSLTLSKSQIKEQERSKSSDGKTTQIKERRSRSSQRNQILSRRQSGSPHDRSARKESPSREILKETLKDESSSQSPHRTALDVQAEPKISIPQKGRLEQDRLDGGVCCDAVPEQSIVCG